MSGSAAQTDRVEIAAWAAAASGSQEGAPADVLTALAAARSYRREANDVAAEAALRAALSTAPDGPVSIATRVALGWQLHLTGHPDEADGELEEALAEASRGKREYLLARTHHVRGVVLFHRGRVDEAGVEFRAALDLDRHAGRAVPNTHSGLADVLAERGDILGARRMYEVARTLARGGKEPGFEAAIAVRLAGALAFEDLDAAWGQAAAAAEGHGDESYWAALAPAIAGFIALARGDRTSAARLAGQASEALLRGFPDLVAGEVLLLRALSGARDGTDPATRRAATEARAIWQRIGNPVWLARAEACLASGDRSPRGRAAFERARRRLRRLGVSRLAFGPGGGPLVALQPESEPLEIRCLGAFAVVRDGVPVPTSAWQSRKARELLKLLIAHRGRPVPREVLMEALWPDEEPEPQANRLSVALATVRAVLDPDRAHAPSHFVTSDGDRYGLDLGHLPIDAERFLAQVAEARGDTDPTDARDALEAAESGYTGDAFEDDPYADWAIPYREEGRAAYAETARTLARLAIDRGDVDAAVRYTLRLLERDPHDEEAHLRLVAMLLSARRFGDARRAHGVYAARMAELGVEAAPFALQATEPLDEPERSALGGP